MIIQMSPSRPDASSGKLNRKKLLGACSPRWKGTNPYTSAGSNTWPLGVEQFLKLSPSPDNLPLCYVYRQARFPNITESQPFKPQGLLSNTCMYVRTCSYRLVNLNPRFAIYRTEADNFRLRYDKRRLTRPKYIAMATHHGSESGEGTCRFSRRLKPDERSGHQNHSLLVVEFIEKPRKVCDEIKLHGVKKP